MKKEKRKNEKLKIRKKICISLGAILFVLIVLPMISKIELTGRVNADTYKDYQYDVLYDGTVEITKYTGNEERVIIPDKIDGKIVECIWSYAFSQCKCKEIQISSGIVYIDEYAFKECNNLISIEIPDSVTSIGNYAFYRCSSLEKITIPKSVTSIGAQAFYACKGLKSINVSEDNKKYKSIDGVLLKKENNGTRLIKYPEGKDDKSYYKIPKGVTSIGDFAFSNCSSLKKITIPDSVTSIGNYAFSSCSSLTSITIPDSVTSIGYGAFSNCSSLKKITIPKSIKSEGCYVFYNCEKLEEMEIPDGVTSIGNSAFSGCSSLTSITIPNSVTSIGDFAFSNCSSLTSITIPDSVTSIGYGAFDECSSLTSITIPDSVTSIGNYAFSECSSLTSITIPDSVTSIGNSAFSSCSSLTSITIPDSVTSIGEEAFFHCESLTEITISKNVTSIGNEAFYSCSSLEKIAIPESVTSIGDFAFAWCSKLDEITIPDSVTNLGEYVFYLCKGLKSIKIPESIKSAECYYFHGCENLEEMKIPDGVTSIGDSAFSGCSSLTSITIPESVTSIGDSAFSGCSSLTRITIPESVTSIGDFAFSSCRSLTSITIPDSVTSIGNYAFSSCSSLTEITIPTRIKSAKCYYFNGCKKLKEIEIPKGVTSIESKSFYECESLESIKIPKSVTSIGDSAFSYCKSLTSIAIPKSVTSIGDDTFCRCISLTSITIPDSVTSIGEDAFFYCESLESIKIPKNVTSIGDNAFDGVRGPIQYYGANKAMKEYIRREDLSQNIYKNKYKRLDSPQITKLKVVSVGGKKAVYNKDDSYKIYIKKNSKINIRLTFGEEINKADIDKISIDGTNSKIEVTEITNKDCMIKITGGSDNGEIKIKIQEGFIKDEFGNMSKEKENILPQTGKTLNIYLDNEAPKLLKTIWNEGNEQIKFKLNDLSYIKAYKLTVYKEYNDEIERVTREKNTLRVKNIELTKLKVSKFNRVTVEVTDVLGNSTQYTYNPYVKTYVKFVERNENEVTYRITTSVKIKGIDDKKVNNIDLPENCSVGSLKNDPDDKTGKKFLLKIKTNSNSESGTIKLAKGTIYAYNTNDKKEAEIEMNMDNELPSIEHENLELENGKTRKISFKVTFKDSNSGIKYYKIERTKTDEEKAKLTDNNDMIVIKSEKVYKQNDIQNEYTVDVDFVRNTRYKITVEDYYGNIKTEEFDIKNIDREKPEVKKISFVGAGNNNYKVSIESNEIIQIVDKDGNAIDGWQTNSPYAKNKTFSVSELEETNIIYLSDEAGNKTKVDLQEEYSKYLINKIVRKIQFIDAESGVRVTIDANEKIFILNKYKEDITSNWTSISNNVKQRVCSEDELYNDLDEIYLKDEVGNLIIINLKEEYINFKNTNV